MRRLRSEDKKILQNAKTEATNHCLNELSMCAELLDLKGKSTDAKLGGSNNIWVYIILYNDIFKFGSNCRFWPHKLTIRPRKDPLMKTSAPSTSVAVLAVSNLDESHQ